MIRWRWRVFRRGKHVYAKIVVAYITIVKNRDNASNSDNILNFNNGAE